MRSKVPNPTSKTFKEPYWLQLLFILSHGHRWQSEAEMQLLLLLPIRGIHRLMEKGYRLRITALEHIVKRHYNGVSTDNDTGKFDIPLLQLLRIIKNAANLPCSPVKSTGNLQRLVICTTKIGVDKSGNPTRRMVIITSPDGDILTAFPLGPEASA